MQTDYLSGEESIVWNEDIDALPYVRSVAVLTSTRDQPITIAPGTKGVGGAASVGAALGARVVGYSVLRSDAAPSFPCTFRRRVFFLALGDRANDPTGAYRTSCPIDAVDPLTIAPGVRGQVTERAWPRSRAMRLPSPLISSSAAAAMDANFDDYHARDKSGATATTESGR